MSKMMMLGVAAMVAAVGAPMVARADDTTRPMAVQADARMALGREIAALLNSEAITIAQTRRMFDTTMPDLFGKDPNLAMLEKQYPGIIRHMVDSARPVILNNVTTQLPVLWDRLAPVYAGALTETEMRESLAFYRSPTGVWLIDTMANNADFTQAMGRMMQDPDGKIEAADLKAGAVDASMGALIQGMNADRMRAVMAFATTPAGLKMRSIQPKLLAISTDWANESDPDTDARVERIVGDSLTQFIADHEAKN